MFVIFVLLYLQRSLFKCPQSSELEKVHQQPPPCSKAKQNKKKTQQKNRWWTGKTSDLTVQ